MQKPIKVRKSSPRGRNSAQTKRQTSSRDEESAEDSVDMSDFRPRESEDTYPGNSEGI